MSNNHLLIGIVGKPSSGKSTFLNSICNTDVKMASYPFTTLEPNVGITYYRTECICHNNSSSFSHQLRYDECVNGYRYIPIKIVDVPGLIPGASEGKGLGNRFLDSIRKAKILIHILDSSGRTNEKGEQLILSSEKKNEHDEHDFVEGDDYYDCSNDVDWIWEEIINWIHVNLKKKWKRIVKLYKLQKHELQIEDLLVQFLGGYSTNKVMLKSILDQMNIFSREFYLRNYVSKQNNDNDNDNEEEKEQQLNKEEEEIFLQKEKFGLEDWKEEHVYDFVRNFVKLRFPLILVCNKIDVPGAEQNIMKIFEKFRHIPSQSTSALSELFLKKMNEKGIIEYVQGEDDFKIKNKEKVNKKILKKLKRIKENVLEEYGSTGCLEAIKLAIDTIDPVIVFPLFNKQAQQQQQQQQQQKEKEEEEEEMNKTMNKVVGDCVIMNKDQTVDNCLDYIDVDVVVPPLRVERLDGTQVSGKDKIKDNNVLVFKHCKLC